MSNTPDVNEVIDGLKCCYITTNCDGCPYAERLSKISLKTPDNYCPILDDTLALLKEYKELKAQPEWIPIEDAKKPEHNQKVWVAYRISYNGEIGTRLAKYRDYGKTHWLNIWDAVFWEDVIAWMPLENPEPPKKGSEAE